MEVPEYSATSGGSEPEESHPKHPLYELMSAPTRLNTTNWGGEKGSRDFVRREIGEATKSLVEGGGRDHSIRHRDRIMGKLSIFRPAPHNLAGGSGA